MHDFFGSPPGRGPQSPFDLEKIDVSGLPRLARLAFLGLTAILLLLALGWFFSFYADWLWFSELGYQHLLLKVVTTQVWLFMAAALLVALFAGVNLFLAFRWSERLSRYSEVVVPPKLYETAKKALRLVAAAVVILLSFFFASNLAGQWDPILRALEAMEFRQTDPIFGRDLGFYVFTLPVLHFLRGMLMGVVVLSAVMVAAVYYLLSRLKGEMLTFSGTFRTHMLSLGALVFVLLAVGHWLSRFELLYSTQGAVHGVGYTDAHANLPALTFMTVVALAGAVALLFAIQTSGNRLILGAAAAWFGLNVVAIGLIPSLFQRLSVEPSELAREEPYLRHHIEMTRLAYGLDRIRSRSHPALGNVDVETIVANEATVSNIRLWDEGPLLQSYNQIQFFRLYYDFLAVTTDRYQIDGELRQVMLSSRELSAEKLPSEAQRWINRHLQFTHGYGVAMSPVTEVDAGGRPAFFVQDVPPRGKLELKRPEVYYGLKSLDFHIVRSRMMEFNYPGPDGQPVYTHYGGNGGVLLDSFLRRLLYAWHFRDLNILISGEIEPTSRIQYRRTVSDRFSAVTPFLLRDSSPYIVVADGRLFWIQDAYTVTNRYPYSLPWRGRFNYIRNSVKAVIDAYDGTIDYYVSDPDDPIVQTYDRIFPGLFKPMEEMPGYLKPHVRYPMDAFTVQVQMLLQYHMQDPGVFYNKEDQWALPYESSFGRTSLLRPYYMVARLPEEEKEEFLLIQPFTPVERHNLVAWIAARNDGPNYGELSLFRFPSGRHVDGPNQVEARIDNDATISEQFTLWGQVGSEVSRGILLVIPIGDSILYAEPVFLRPETLDFPELRRIILADATRVVMHPTLDRSVQALVGDLPAVAPVAAPFEDVPVRAELERTEPRIRSRDLEAIQRGLEDAVGKLQEVIQLMRQLNSPEGGGGGSN